METATARWWRDPLFFFAAAAALLYWLALFIATDASPNLAWPLDDPLRFLYPALFYPIIEEVVFRGFIQDLAHRHIRPWSIGPLSHANILTSILFTGLHFINHPPLWAAAVFLPSLVFGFFKDRSGALIAPILLHVFYNSGYFWMFGQ